MSQLDEHLYAISDVGQGSFTEKWAFATGGQIFSSPAVGAEGTIYIGSSDHNLYAVTDTGAIGIQKWVFATGDAVLSSPAIGADRTIYAGSNDGNLYAVTDNGANAGQKWALTLGGVFSSPAIGADGTIYR